MNIKFLLGSVAALGLFLVGSMVRAADQAPAAAPASAPAQVPADTAAETPTGSIEVMRMVLTSQVQDREPGAEITAAKVGDAVVCFTQIRSGVGETTVTHRWMHEAENSGDVSLAIKGSPWRTYSRKTVSEPGNWKVQVLDSAGSVLKEASFSVTQ